MFVSKHKMTKIVGHIVQMTLETQYWAELYRRTEEGAEALRLATAPCANSCGRQALVRPALTATGEPTIEAGLLCQPCSTQRTGVEE